MLRSGRFWNIAFRTFHIAVIGILLGGHVFDVPESRLWGPLWLVIGSGAALTALEAWSNWYWPHQGRGVLVMAKVLLLCVIPFAWTCRVPILLTVVVIASVGSHMPGRFRYYSLYYRQVLKCRPDSG